MPALPRHCTHCPGVCHVIARIAPRLLVFDTHPHCECGACAKACREKEGHRQGNHVASGVVCYSHASLTTLLTHHAMPTTLLQGKRKKRRAFMKHSNTMAADRAAAFKAEADGEAAEKVEKMNINKAFDSCQFLLRGSPCLLALPSNRPGLYLLIQMDRPTSFLTSRPSATFRSFNFGRLGLRME